MQSFNIKKTCISRLISLIAVQKVKDFFEERSTTFFLSFCRRLKTEMVSSFPFFFPSTSTHDSTCGHSTDNKVKPNTYRRRSSNSSTVPLFHVPHTPPHQPPPSVRCCRHQVVDSSSFVQRPPLGHSRSPLGSFTTAT